MDNKLRIIIYSLITLLLSSCIGLDGCNDWVHPTKCEVEREFKVKYPNYFKEKRKCEKELSTNPHACDNLKNIHD